jgi:hypothetical protein
MANISRTVRNFQKLSQQYFQVGRELSFLSELTESSANTERLKKGPSNDSLSSSLPQASDKGLGSHEGSLTILKTGNNRGHVIIVEYVLSRCDKTQELWRGLVV